MSRANLMVRFSDGSIRYGLYCGTSDLVMSPLYDTAAQAWDVYTNFRPDAWGTGEQFARYRGAKGQPVEIFTDYGGGFWWRGEALPEWVTGGIEPFEVEYFDGAPDWAKGENK